MIFEISLNSDVNWVFLEN